MRQRRWGGKEPEELNIEQVSAAASVNQINRMRPACAGDVALCVEVSLSATGSRNRARPNQGSRKAIQTHFNITAGTGTGHAGNKSIHAGQIDAVVGRPIAIG